MRGQQCAESLRLNLCGSYPSQLCCVDLISFPKTVIPACFKRESRRIRNWTPDKNIRG